MHVLGSDALVECAEVAEDGSLNFFESGGIGGERSVVDGDRAEAGIVDGEERGVGSAHAPAYGAEAMRVHGFQGLEVIDGGDEIANAAVLRKSAHEFVGGFGIVGGFAAIEIDGEGDVSLISEVLGLFFDPGDESPPLVDDDNGGMRARRRGGIEEAVNGFAGAWERDFLRVNSGKERGGDEDEREDDGEMFEADHWRASKDSKFRPGAHSANLAVPGWRSFGREAAKLRRNHPNPKDAAEVGERLRLSEI